MAKKKDDVPVYLYRISCTVFHRPKLERVEVVQHTKTFLFLDRAVPFLGGWTSKLRRVQIGAQRQGAYWQRLFLTEHDAWRACLCSAEATHQRDRKAFDRSSRIVKFVSDRMKKATKRRKATPPRPAKKRPAARKRLVSDIVV